MAKPDTTDLAAKRTILGTGGTLGAGGGYSIAHTAGTILAGKTSGTALAALAAKGLVGKGALAVLAAHPAGLAAIGAGVGIWATYKLCKKIFGEEAQTTPAPTRVGVSLVPPHPALGS